MRHYFGKYPYIAGQIVLNICLQASNIASIVVAAQVMDDFMVYAFKSSYAFDFQHFKFLKSEGLATDDNPFGSHIWIISLGYIVAMAVCIPFGFLNLDDNMWFQWFSFVGMMASFAMFYVLFFLAGAGVIHAGDDSPAKHVPPHSSNHSVFDAGPPPPHAMNLTSPNNMWLQPMTDVRNLNLRWNTERVPVFGTFIGQANVIGTVIFMSAFVTSIPSWVNEKKPHVSINKSIWSSTLTSNFIKLSFGYFAGITYRTSKSSNILNVISRHAPPGALGVVTRISVYMFNFATIIPGIPVISILVRYNLVTGKLCPPIVANLIGVVAPWVLSMFFYHGQGLSIVVNWSAILFQGFVNFAIPALLYLFAIRLYPHFPEIVIENDPNEETPIVAINDDAPAGTSPQDHPTATGCVIHGSTMGYGAIVDDDEDSSANIHRLPLPLQPRPTNDKTDSKDSQTKNTSTSTLNGTDSDSKERDGNEYADLDASIPRDTDSPVSTNSSTDPSSDTSLSGSIISRDDDKDGQEKISKESTPDGKNGFPRSSIDGIHLYDSIDSDHLHEESISSLEEDIELAKPKSTPGWFFANQKLKLRPVDALPRSLPNTWKMIAAIGIIVSCVLLTVVALSLDFYFLSQHQDIVDN